MKIPWQPLVAGLLALLVVTAARAQVRIELAPPAAIDCLQVAAGEPTEPVYPFDQYKERVAGRVRASVTLTGGSSPNGIEILSQEGDAPFAESSRRFLRALSAPCMKSGETVTLVYDFVFRPDLRTVVWSGPEREGDAARRAMTRCVQHLEGLPHPPYPDEAKRSNQQGRVLGRMTFSSADSEPEVELWHRPSARIFRPAIQRWAARMRMPCHQGAPVTTEVVFVFRFVDEGAYGFKPLTLVNLLGLSKGIRERRLELDTTTMGCPFQLKWSYQRPLLRNAVGEVGDSDPRRRPLLELLAGLELNLQDAALDSVFADTADVAVPCIRLNLNDPKEKTS